MHHCVNMFIFWILESLHLTCLSLTQCYDVTEVQIFLYPSTSQQFPFSVLPDHYMIYTMNLIFFFTFAVLNILIPYVYKNIGSMMLFYLLLEKNVINLNIIQMRPNEAALRPHQYLERQIENKMENTGIISRKSILWN